MAVTHESGRESEGVNPLITKRTSARFGESRISEKPHSHESHESCTPSRCGFKHSGFACIPEIGNTEAAIGDQTGRVKMPSQKQLVDRGIEEVEHWPTFERYPPDREFRRTSIGSMVGMFYDTAGWPQPDEVYHPDNYREWHCDDPNRPAHTQEELDEENAVMEKWET